MHEAQRFEQNCFVTLTYAPGNLPADASLEHRDFQLFMKRLRKAVKRPVRFYMCGEYGDENLRPHFHACLFNVDFREDRVYASKSASGFAVFESAQLSKIWGLGRVSVQDLTRETASYCARYIMKKVLGPDSEKAYESIGDDGVIVSRRPEYAAMSLKPGIGFSWFDRYSRDCFPHDYVIQGGVKRQIPRYYDKLLKRQKPVLLEDVQFKRETRARESFEDQTPERLEVRKKVHEARVSTLKRSLEP